MTVGFRNVLQKRNFREGGWGGSLEGFGWVEGGLKYTRSVTASAQMSLRVLNYVARSLLQRDGGESGVKSAGTASCASIPTLRAAQRVIDSCAQVTAHKSKHIPLRQTLTSPTWNFHARKSSGQVSAEALRESSVSPERAVLPGLLVTTLPPSAAGRKSSRHRARRVPATEGPSQPPPAPGSSCGNAGYFIKCSPTSALSKMIPVGRDFSHRNTCL